MERERDPSAVNVIDGGHVGYLVGMRAGTDDPATPPAESLPSVSSANSLPSSLIGFLGDQVTVLCAHLLIAALQAVALLIAGPR